VEAGQGGRKGERYDSVVSVSVPYRGGAGCSADADGCLARACDDQEGCLI
jgi:hypothetical protein